MQDFADAEKQGNADIDTIILLEFHLRLIDHNISEHLTHHPFLFPGFTYFPFVILPVLSGLADKFLSAFSAVDRNLPFVSGHPELLSAFGTFKDLIIPASGK